MTYTDFIYKYNTRYIDFDGVYGPQCVDLFKAFNKEVVGAPNVNGNAKDYWYNYPSNATLKTYYDRIPNTLTFIPQKGDVMIWDGWSSNPYGHIAIVDNASLMWFTSFDQNYPLGSPCHFVSHSYIKPRVLGVLRPKSIQI